MYSNIHVSINQTINSIPQYPEVRWFGKGIVTTSYNKEFPCSYVMLTELSRLQCNLPIEVFYKDGELTKSQIKIIENISPLIQVKLLQDESIGFAIKPFAILESSFQEVLWIDADNIPVKDPSSLFTDEDYLEKGSLFWKDVGATRNSVSQDAWKLFNITPNDSDEFETGQLLIDKKKCWKQFWLTLYFNNNAHIFYQFIHGDKDTFRFSWTIHGELDGNKLPSRFSQANRSLLPYGLIPFVPDHIGLANQENFWGGGSVLAQKNRSGEIIFHHRTLCKFKLNENNSFQPNVKNEALYHLHIENLKLKIQLEKDLVINTNEDKFIVILHIATGKYSTFTEEFISTAAYGFEKNYKKIIVVFSDQNYQPSRHYDNIHEVIQIKIENEPWPYNTLKRYQYFELAKEKLKKYKSIAIFFANANATFINANPLTEIMKLKSQMAFVQHPGFIETEISPPFEHNLKSTAYLASDLHFNTYIQGFFYGGITEAFWNFNSIMLQMLTIDLTNNIIPIWHDESYLNAGRIKFLLDSSIVLDAGYASPEGMLIPYTTKIFSKSKNKFFPQDFKN